MTKLKEAGEICRDAQLTQKTLPAKRSPVDYPARETPICVYAGMSMHPTLLPQDILAITPYTTGRPRRGDVILFHAPGLPGPVVHRISGRTAAGYRTQGDNCPNEDPWLLTEREIIGRVVVASRQTGSRRIHGGETGRLQALLCHPRRNLLPVLHPLFRALTRAIRRLCRPGHFFLSRNLHLYVFTNRNRADYRLMAGGKIIGTYDHTVSRWRIRLPYRLAIDESFLPLPPCNADLTGS